MTQYKLIYNFQTKDHRDYIYESTINTETNNENVIINKKGNTTLKTVKSSPNSFTVSNLPTILDQGNLGTCVTNAFSFCVSSQTKNNILLSRLFLYAVCRSIDFIPLNQDDGTTIRSACKAITTYGACKESVYPYNISQFSNLPPLNVFNNCKNFRKFTYLFISQNITSIKNCLSTYNCPIIFGFLVYSSFLKSNVATTGVVPLPNKKTETLEGGHCMCIVGYNDSTKMFTCANSWGTNWGKKGYCYIPYDYLLDPKLASDFCFTQFIY